MEFDNLKDELLSVTDTGLKYAKSLDSSSEFEIYVFFRNVMKAEIDQGVVSAKDGAVAGTAVRAAKGKCLGFAAASGVSEDRVKRATREALAIVQKVNVEDERFEGFADSKGTRKEGAFTNELLELGTDDLIKACEKINADAASVDERLKVVSSESYAEWGGYAVGNTRGVLHATRGGYSQCQCSAYAIEVDERRGSFDFDFSRDRLFDPEGVGKKAGTLAVSLLGAKKLDLTAKIPTIWTPFPAGLYMLSSLALSAVGKPVVDGVSPLCDKIGEQIAPKHFAVIDDGQGSDKITTQAIDAEGLPQRETPIIEKGVLKNFLFDSYYGNAFGLESTGNCSKGSALRPSPLPYESRPSATTKWLDVTPGTKSDEDIISSIDGKAILVQDYPLGITHSSVATGEFSCVATAAYLVENGELKGSVEPVSIAGNFYEGLKNLLEISNEPVSIPYGIDVPTLVFDGFSVVG
jgi:PmbA protein